jgi:hypothetical protein
MPVLVENRSEKKLTEVMSDRSSKREELNGLTKLDTFKIGAVANGNTGNYSLFRFPID